MAEVRRETEKKNRDTAERNLKDTLHPDRAKSDELGHESDDTREPAPGPRELPAQAVHPEGRGPEEDE